MKKKIKKNIKFCFYLPHIFWKFNKIRLILRNLVKLVDIIFEKTKTKTRFHNNRVCKRFFIRLKRFLVGSSV